MSETAKRRTAKRSIRHFQDLDVYQNALAVGLRVYEVTRSALEVADQKFAASSMSRHKKNEIRKSDLANSTIR